MDRIDLAKSLVRIAQAIESGDVPEAFKKNWKKKPESEKAEKPDFLKDKEKKSAASIEAGGNQALAAIKEIAALDESMISLLDDTGQKMVRMETSKARIADELFQSLRMLRGEDKVNRAKAIIASMELYRIDTGTLSSRFIDDLESTTGQPLFPPPWQTEKAQWNIVGA